MAFCPTCEAVKALMMSRGFDPVTSEAVAESRPVRKADKIVKRKVKRGATKASRKLGRALKEINKKARKKNGDFKKGYTQGRVMRDAHKLARRMR